MRSPRSLRARLIAVALALTSIGIAIAGVATYTSLRSFLVDRLDQDLEAASASVARDLLRQRGEAFEGVFGPRPRGARPGQALPRGTVWELRSEKGDQLIGTRDVALPTRLPVGIATSDLRGVGAYRFNVVPVRDTSGQDIALVVGIPMGDVNDTLQRLLLISLLVGALALAAAGAAGYWLVRLGLRPLSDIEVTAGQIAGGDLSRRIDDTSPDTEVGRLGGALNAMLGRIETAFAEREASEKRLRQFVADASHELQTPLTSVRGYAELFRRGAADRPEDLATAMTRIEAESERMGLLVDDMLLLARLDERRPIETSPVDLTQMARELVADARIVDPTRRYDLRLDAPVEVRGDRDRLAQVVGNLLRNVRAHTPDGTTVTIAVRHVGDDALVEVADEGPGMSADQAARVFERFFRADKSRARVSGGTGLGLAIVAATAEAHGGRVEVETSPGAGATFRVWLPVHRDSQETPSTV